MINNQLDLSKPGVAKLNALHMEGMSLVHQLRFTSSDVPVLKKLLNHLEPKKKVKVLK